MSTGWMPLQKECISARLILSEAYMYYGDIYIFVNDNGTLVSKSLKELWMIPKSYVLKSYPNALQDSNAFSSKLIKDYGRYGFRESKIAKLKKKLITEKKKSFLSK
jgi:hypothetical protein